MRDKKPIIDMRTGFFGVMLENNPYPQLNGYNKVVYRVSLAFNSFRKIEVIVPKDAIKLINALGGYKYGTWVILTDKDNNNDFIRKVGIECSSALNEIEKQKRIAQSINAAKQITELNATKQLDEAVRKQLEMMERYRKPDGKRAPILYGGIDEYEE